jgi:hypothetical protein
VAVWEHRRDRARSRWIAILDANGVDRKVRDERAGGNRHGVWYSDRGVATCQADDDIRDGLYCKFHLPGASQRPRTIVGIAAATPKGCRPDGKYVIVEGEAARHVGGETSGTRAVQLKGFVDYVLSVVRRDGLRHTATWPPTDAARPGQVVIRLPTEREMAWSVIPKSCVKTYGGFDVSPYVTALL